MGQRARVVGLLTVGSIASGLAPAAAQGDPVFGVGNLYLYAGAGNVSGQAVEAVMFGDPDDEVHSGDFVDADGAFGTARSYAYGNVDDWSFAALPPWTYDLDGTPDTLFRDGLAGRR